MLSSLISASVGTLKATYMKDCNWCHCLFITRHCLVVTARCSIFFNDWFCIFSIASISLCFGILSPAMLQTIAGARHVSKNLNFTLISSCPTFCFDDIPFIFLNIVLASLSVSFMCSFRFRYLLCLALFLSCMYK